MIFHVGHLGAEVKSFSKYWSFVQC